MLLVPKIFKNFLNFLFAGSLRAYMFGEPVLEIWDPCCWAWVESKHIERALFPFKNQNQPARHQQKVINGRDLRSSAIVSLCIGNFRSTGQNYQRRGKMNLDYVAGKQYWIHCFFHCLHLSHLVACPYLNSMFYPLIFCDAVFTLYLILNFM